MVKYERATFAAGCFWGVEELFRTLPGVKSTTVGYTGGKIKNPSYALVCTSLTGHAEAVQLEFNPKKVSYEKLLKIFWENHNPTTLNRQGFDIGTQYRSAIFYHSLAQKKAAEQSKAELGKSGKFRRPIVTHIVAAAEFYPAEEYHQKYLMKKGEASCNV
jgi:peptide-methionine (S)-S-oxide reductase